MRKKENGYLTVEAALVFPIVLAVQILIIYLFVFQYDRCLLNQDMARLVVLGCGAEEQGKSELAEYLKECMGELYMEKYVAWETDSVGMELKGDIIYAEGRGKLMFPGIGWGDWGEAATWDAAAACEGKKIQPAVLIRQCRKWKGEQ